MLVTQKPASLLARHKGYEYQLQAVNSLKDLPYGAVFHEQGLGKTKIGIDLALTWLKNEECDSVIFITKRSLLKNWEGELEAHTFTSPRLLTQDRNSNFFAFNSPARIYLTHYEVIRSEQKRLRLFLKTRKVGVVLDEAHYFKNPESTVSDALFSISDLFVKKIIMTGTPVANRPYDIWSQIYFLDAGASLGKDFKAFKNVNDLSGDLAQDTRKAEAFENAVSKIFGKISAFTVRDTKASSGIELPTKTILSRSTELAPRQAEIYRAYRDDIGAMVVQRGKPVLDDVENLLKRLLRLVQVASNPGLVDDAYNEEPGKLSVASDIVSEFVPNGKKVILWTNFVENVSWLRKHFASFDPAVITGRMSAADRDSSVRRFKEASDCGILIATPASAKEGLTLTVANCAIFFDRSFSLDDYLQAQDRIHRISQVEECFVYNLVAENTVDEWVSELLAAKQLAAELAQGDISLDEYKQAATYEFGELLGQILGVEV